jgi:hypothetical protein
MRQYAIWVKGWQDHKLDESQWSKVMHPNSVPWRLIAEGDDYRIEVEGIEVSISDDGLSGISVVFHGESVPRELARRVVEEVLSNIQQAIGQEGWIVEAYLH